MARDDPQTNIRLPAELKERLMESARQANRTFGAEVVMRLELSFRTERVASMAEDVAALTTVNAERVEKALAEMKEIRASMEAQLAEAAEYLGKKAKR